MSARTSYSVKSNLRDYEKHKYYENLLLKNTNFVNPNLKFETPFKFKLKLTESIMTKSLQLPKNLNNNNLRPFSGR
jgi:hypothetical protein